MIRCPYLQPVATALAIMLATISGSVSAAEPVVLELFTSNSCSSCPPAYRALDRLTGHAADKPYQIIRLDEHVDYWNQLDWVDRYSSAAFTDRQNRYANDVFHTGQVYTPQLVINGHTGLVGSRGDAAQQAIDAQAGQVAPLALAVTRSGHQIHVRATLPASGPEGQLWFALTQDHVISHVGAGENAGRTLVENGVVREMVTAASGATTTLSIPNDTAPSDLHVVAFIQNDAHRIVAAAQRPVLR